MNIQEEIIEYSKEVGGKIYNVATICQENVYTTHAQYEIMAKNLPTYIENLPPPLADQLSIWFSEVVNHNNKYVELFQNLGNLLDWCSVKEEELALKYGK